jgi:phospholipase/carboxylesterase
MKGKQYQGKGLRYITILPEDYDPAVSYPLVIMLHGFGANMMDLSGLAPVINDIGYVYACPNAPISFNLGMGQMGYGWYPPRGQASPEQVQQAEALLAGFFDEVFQELKTTPGQAVLMGFSQGGGMTYRCGLGRPDAFAGLAALSASVPNPQELEPKLPGGREQPIFVAHGRADSLVSLESARATRKFLEGAGYQPEYHEYEMAHQISDEVIQDLTPWLARVLPPLVAHPHTK